YDGTRDELWDALDLHFRAPCLVPTITAQPVAQNVCPGGAAVFSVTAEGDGPLSYQWQKDEGDLVEGGHYTGVQTPTLTVSNTDAGDVAAYRCVVSIESTATPSDSAALSLKAATAITGQPDSQAVLWGGTAQFNVSATGEGTLSYQWQKDLTDLVEGGHYSGVNSPMLTIAGANADDVAEYRCVVTAGCGSATSNAATLTVAAMGDFDGDSDVDMADFGTFSFCFNGPNRPLPSPGCYVVDFDADSDVDLTDFSAFQACFNGPNRPPACAG
ncbi:MAG: immunoglobulin domain-containing protein, partial [Phycisphaerae bacterium]|nr:immunoglobulin domain-containing protein [Phycisphaerae bacterium]